MAKVPVMGAAYVDEEALQGNDTGSTPDSASGSGAGTSAGTSGGTSGDTGAGAGATSGSSAGTGGVYNAYYDEKLLEASKKTLSTEMPSDGEVSNTLGALGDELRRIQSKYGTNYLDSDINRMYVGGNGDADILLEVNKKYAGFVDSLQKYLSEYNVDEDGAVDAPEGSSAGGGGGGTGTGYEGVGSDPGIDASGVGSENASPSVPSYEPSTSEKLESGSAPEYQPKERSDDYESPSRDTQLRESYDTPTSGGGASGGGSAMSGLGGAAAATGGALGTAAAAALGDVGGLGAAGSTVLDNIDYPSGNYTVAQGFAERLTDEEKDEVTKILEEYGYTKEEIEAVLNGEFNTSKILVDRMSKEMQDIIESDPGIRNEILARYGFDIYTETGELDKDKLALALYLDDMNGQDEFSLISMLSDRGVNLVDMDLMGQYSSKLEDLLLSNYNIKKLLSDKYGFDFYNLDGSINKDRLILAMLIDEETGTSLLDVINEAATGDVFSTLNTSINSLQRPTPTSSGGGAGLGTAAVLTAAGAAGAIGYAVHKKKKKEKEAEEEKPDISYSDKTFDIDKYEPDTNEVGTGGSKMSQWVNQAINDAS